MKRVPIIISIAQLLRFYANAQPAADGGSSIKDGKYVSPEFGFRLRLPEDGAVHGEATNERIRELGKEKMAESGAVAKSNAEVSLRNTHHLLTVSRYAVG